MSPAPRVACLTPPSMGGIAVIEVVGEHAIALVNPHLRHAGRPIDLAGMSPADLRLCRITDGDETLDDVVVCIRPSAVGGHVIDLNVHGGPRIVQRVLLMLQQDGAEIVEPSAMLHDCWPTDNTLQADALARLPKAQTRRAAIWLAGLPDLLGQRLREIVDAIRTGRLDDARSTIAALLDAVPRVRLLIDGVRIVLIGPPNSGKSTLANAMAEREHAIVSDIPGTTRDWTEHPAAIDGVPIVVVDTAGLRETDDPIEQEAIARAAQQYETADLVLQVIDATARPTHLGVSHFCATDPKRERAFFLPTQHLLVLNKTDLQQTVTLPDIALPVSARTGAGLDDLRARVLDAVGLASNTPWPIGPYAPNQHGVLTRAAMLLAREDGNAAVELLQNLLDSPLRGRTTAPSGV